MKTIIKIIFLCGIIGITAFSCEKEDIPEWSDFVEGYVVGSFKCRMENNASVLTPLGFCILLEENKDENSQNIMDFYTLNLPYELINYPEVEQTLIYGPQCGPVVFPDSIQSNLKIKFRYRYFSDKDKLKFVCGFCVDIFPPFPWVDYEEASLKDVIIVENQ